MSDVGWANMVRHGTADSWLTVLFTPTYPGSGRYASTAGPVTPGKLGFEGPAAWLRDQGFEITAWTNGPNGGFRAELRAL